MITKDPIFELCDKVRETAFSLHAFLRHGHKEIIYENGLSHRLSKQGIKVEQQLSLQVMDDDGTVLGDLLIDMMIENELVIEIKAAKAIVPEHIAQLLGYLRACRKEHGLLINFGASKLEIRKYILSKELGSY
jgi:GxxExxY protein